MDGGAWSAAWGSPWGREESDTTEQLHFHFSLSRIGEGNGNPLQCSCLENPRDGGACWAAVYGVAQSRTQLMRLSSSSACNEASVKPRGQDSESFQAGAHVEAGESGPWEAHGSSARFLCTLSCASLPSGCS